MAPTTKANRRREAATENAHASLREASGLPKGGDALNPGEHEEGRVRTAKAMFGIYVASKNYMESYMEAYRAFQHAQKTGDQDEQMLLEVVSRLRELVAHCELYLREHPEDHKSIELVIDQLVAKRDKEEAGGGGHSQRANTESDEAPSPELLAVGVMLAEGIAAIDSEGLSSTESE